MNPPDSQPPWVRHLPDDEAVWTAYQRRRVSRALAAALPERLRALAGDEEVSEEQDWLAAERECGRVVEAHGHCVDARG